MGHYAAASATAFAVTATATAAAAIAATATGPLCWFNVRRPLKEPGCCLEQRFVDNQGCMWHCSWPLLVSPCLFSLTD